jgi:putative lipoprotein
MKKLSNFVWLLAIALGAAIALTACSKNSDGPDGGEDKGKVEVNPTKVFVNGMPKIVDGSVFTRDFKGRLSSIYNREENVLIAFAYTSSILGTKDVPNVVMTVTDGDERTVYNLFLNKDGFVKYCDEIDYEKKGNTPKTTTWNFEYNSDGQLIKAVESKDGVKTSSTIAYNDGDAVETVTMSEKDGKETDHYRIYYTSKKVTLPIENRGCIMSFDVALGLDLDHLHGAYYAGMLGKATKHLPIYNMDKDNDKTTFDWILNDNGFPTKIVVKDDEGRAESNIVW